MLNLNPKSSSIVSACHVNGGVQPPAVTEAVMPGHVGRFTMHMHRAVDVIKTSLFNGFGKRNEAKFGCVTIATSA